MNESAHLYQLQKIDHELDYIDQRIKEIDQILSSTEKLQEADQNITEAKRRTHSALQGLRAVEDEVKSVVLKKEQNESTLYSGKIKNPKELQDLENEQAILKKRIQLLEDEQLEKIIYFETLEEQEKERVRDYKNLQAELISQNSEIQGEKDKLEQNKTRLGIEREVTLRSISSANLQSYNQLRNSKRGLAVAIIRDDSCSACGASLRPAEIQAANSSKEMFYCASCGRILFSG
ncbi:MAG: hypothetical protein IT308_02910 [Anaerolineaceae bacterium]|nr:hypothetical protein [Anaerolineaceae bacterium]